MNMRQIIIALLTLCMTCAFAQISPYSPGGGEGVVYYLPKTGLRIAVQVERTTYTPGDLCRYAERNLKLKDVSLEPSTTYKVLTFNISTYAVPDSDRCFTMRLNPKSAAANIQLSDDGILLSINAEPKTIDAPEPFVPSKKAAAVDPRQFLTEEMLSTGSTSKLAELVALEIYDIRESRAMLTRGQADFMPTDGEQLRLMLSDLAIQDAALTSLFGGTTVRDTTEHVLYYVPEPDSSIGKEVLFRLSRTLGLTAADDLSGAPYYISVEDLHTAPAPDELAVAAMAKSAKSGGAYVNVAGKARVKILQGSRELLSSTLIMGQYGYVELLSNDLFFKHPTTRMVLNPLTGAILSLDALQPDR